jgi:transposase
MLVCMTVPEDSPRWVTLREAAEETRASLPALRRWYREGLIRSVVVPGTHGDQRLVDLDEVVSRAAASPNIGRRRRSSPADRDAVIEALIEQVAALSMELSDLRERVEDIEDA